MPPRTRRHLLRASGVSVTLGLAGCAGLRTGSAPAFEPASRVAWWIEPEPGIADVHLADDALFVAGEGGVARYAAGDGGRVWLWSTDEDGAGYPDGECSRAGSVTLVDGVVLAVVCGHAHGLDARTGDRLWRTRVPTDATAATDGEFLYVAGRDEVRAVDLADRTTAWTAPVAARKRAPTLANGRLVGGSPDGIYAVDAADGTVRWTRSLDHAGQVPAVDDGTVYVGSRGEDETGRLYALSLADGRTEWAVVAGGLSPEAPPAVTDASVYGGTWLGRLRAHDRSDGSERWTFEADDWLVSQPVVADGTVYAGSNDDHVYAVDAADGTETWRFDCSESAADTPIASDSSLYATSVRYLFALRRER